MQASGSSCYTVTRTGHNYYGSIDPFCSLQQPAPPPCRSRPLYLHQSIDIFTSLSSPSHLTFDHPQPVPAFITLDATALPTCQNILLCIDTANTSHSSISNLKLRTPFHSCQPCDLRRIRISCYLKQTLLQIPVKTMMWGSLIRPRREFDLLILMGAVVWSKIAQKFVLFNFAIAFRGGI